MLTKRGKARLILISSTNTNCESMAYRSFRSEKLSVRGARKVTTGLTGLWQPSVHSDVAFWSFDVGSSYHCEAKFTKRRIVHPFKGTWAGFRPSWDRLVLPYWWHLHCWYGIPVQYERNHRYEPMAQYLSERTLVWSYVRRIMPERL